MFILFCLANVVTCNSSLSLIFLVSHVAHAAFFTTLTFAVVVAVDQAVFVEPLTEERAARTLYRIELLRKIREQVHSKGCGCIYWWVGGRVGVCCGGKDKLIL